MGVTPPALPSEALRRLQVGWVACFWELGSAQGLEKGRREAETLPCGPPGPGPSGLSVHAWHRTLPSIWQPLEDGGCAWET